MLARDLLTDGWPSPGLPQKLTQIDVRCSFWQPKWLALLLEVID